MFDNKYGHWGMLEFLMVASIKHRHHFRGQIIYLKIYDRAKDAISQQFIDSVFTVSC